ncbi:5E5 antigen-like [Drosophila suzukii]|uniref:5E5 antigen-like n=1 Tax=Drosophila suzukii TaxID=28584 RepID=A0ABM4TXK9_DROSZ
MAALQKTRPGQGWSKTRPTRAPRRALERTRDEDSAPEPAVSSDSDVEVIGYPAVEEREWRLRKAAAGGRIPRGTTNVGGAELPRSHSEEVCRATEESRKRFRDREPSDEEQQRSTEEEARWQTRRRQDHEAAAARWHARLREAEEEERRLWEAPAEDSWEVPLTPRYAAEEPSPRSEDGDEPCSPSPPRRRSRRRRRSTVGHAAVEAGPATHAAMHGATTTGGADAKRGVDRAADATTAGGGSPPGTGGGAVGGADGGAGRARKPQHACVCGRGSAVATADGGMDVARGARDGTDEGGAQDMGGGRPQGESSGSPDERPAGCVGSADTKHGPANTGDDGSDGGGGVAGEGTVGVARATGHLKTDVAASSFEPRIDAPAAAVHAASFGPGRRRLARGRQERVAGNLFKFKPRSGLQHGVVQRHERRHAGSKDHVVSHEAVKRILRPVQRPQSGPGAPNKRPAIGVSSPPAAPTHVPTRSTHSAATAPSAASPAPPAAPSAAQTQQRSAPCSATHVAIRCPQSATCSANSAGHVVTSHTTSVTRSAQRAAPRPPQRSAPIGRRHLHHQQHPPSAYRVPTERHQQRPQQRPSAAPSRALSSADRAGYVVTSHATSATRSAQRSAPPLTSRTHRASTGALAATTSVSQCH